MNPNLLGGGLRALRHEQRRRLLALGGQLSHLVRVRVRVRLRLRVRVRVRVRVSLALG